MTTKKFSVGGMSCAACQAAVEKCALSLNGIDAVSVSLMTNSMTLTYDETVLTEEEIFKSVGDAGYSAGPWVKRETSEKEEEEKYRSMINFDCEVAQGEINA